MSLQGVKVISRVIDQMEAATMELTALNGRNPNSVGGHQDENMRSLLHSKLMALQQELEPVITGYHPRQAG